ncbi:MAG: PIG-L family deacetylase [Bacillota bacterium]
MDKTIMSIGCHCLDAELMGGPAVLKHTNQGGKGIFVHMTRGERGNPNKQADEYGIQLEQEMVNVAAKMGASAIWLGYAAGNFPTTSEVVRDLVRLIRQERPAVVITHWRGSLHERHTLTYETVTAAIKAAANPKYDLATQAYRVPKFCYGENCEDLNGFIPQIYSPMTQAELNQWLDALREYELFRGGLLSVPYEAYYTTMAKVRSIEGGAGGLAKAYMYASRVEELHE